MTTLALAVADKLTLLMLTGCVSVFGGGLVAIERQQEVMQ
jgi:hypothetical protein